MQAGSGQPRRRGPRLALAMLLALAAAGSVVFYTQSLERANALQTQEVRQEAVATATTTRNVVVARQNLPAQTALDLGDFQLQAVPDVAVQPDAVSSLSDLGGKVLTTPVAQGEQIVSYRLVDPITATPPVPKTLAETVPRGKRAMSVAFTELAGSGALIAPGDNVDVLAVFNKDTMGKDQSMILLQDVQVLAVGQATSVDQLPRASSLAASVPTPGPLPVPSPTPGLGARRPSRRAL